MSDILQLSSISSSSNNGNVTITGNLVVTNTIYGTTSGGGGNITLDPLNPIEIGTNTTGVGASNTVLIGYNADASAAHGIAIGKNAYVKSAGTYGVAIGSGVNNSSSARAGAADCISIGRDTHSSEVGGVAVGFGASCYQSRGVAVCPYAIVNSVGSEGIAVGRSAVVGVNAVRGIAVGYSAQANGTTSISLGRGATASSTHSIAIGEAANSSGYGAVCVGRAVTGSQADSFNCRIRHVGSSNWATFTSPGAGSGELVNSVSTKLSKQNIRDIENVGDKIDKIRVVRFKADNLDDKGTSHRDMIGIIAEELENVFPELVGYNIDGITPSNVSYPELSSILIKEIQCFKKKLNNVKHRLSILEDITFV